MAPPFTGISVMNRLKSLQTIQRTLSGVLNDGQSSIGNYCFPALRCHRWNEFRARKWTFLINSVVSSLLPFSSSLALSSTASSGHPTELFDCSDEGTRLIVERDFTIIQDFVTLEEESALMKEVERFLKKLRYEYDHWDNAIHGYRETEKSKWTEANNAIIQRIRDSAFPSTSSQLSLVHVLDLAKNGYIKPHVDSVKFCGSTIAGLCLLSPAIMRLVNEECKHQWVKVLLNSRSLYIMRDTMRYQYTHEILAEEESVFNGKTVLRDRRISIMCRNEVSS